MKKELFAEINVENIIIEKNISRFYYGFENNEFKDFKDKNLLNIILKKYSNCKAVFIDYQNNRNSLCFTDKAIYILDILNHSSKVEYENIANIELFSNKLVIESKLRRKNYISSPFNFEEIYKILFKIIDKDKSININYNENENNYNSITGSGVGITSVGITASNMVMTKIVNNPQGHGFAAENINNTNDRLNLKNANILGDDNAKNGPDRISNGTLIQTKYCATPSRCVEACFDENGMFKYVTTDKLGNNINMSIEVPSDMYDEAVKVMARKIENGKVRGITDPNEARNLIKKGSVTYLQAKNIAKFGTIDSIVYDMKTGAVIATNTMCISSTITFAMSVWNGEDYNIALENAAYTAIKVGGTTVITNVLISQLSRTQLNSLLVGSTDAVIGTLGPKVSAFLVNGFRSSNIYGAAAMKNASKLLRHNIVVQGVTVLVLSSVDIFDIFMGRISGTQFAKNLFNLAASVAGGSGGFAAGATLGSLVLPGVGTIIGGLLGGFASGMVAEKMSRELMDKIIEDDATGLIKIIEEKLVEIANEYLLTKDEVAKVSDYISKELNKSRLKEMYKSRNKKQFADELMRNYAKNLVIKRKKVKLPTNNEFMKDMNIIINKLIESEE